MLGAVPGAVTTVGTTITTGPANGMPAITSGVAPTGAGAAGIVAEAGEPLLDSTGHVLGILYDPEHAGSTASSNAPLDPSSTSSASSTTSTAPLLTATAYLPTQLVLGVAGDIRAGTNARHGWLGVTGTDQPAGGGAVVAVVARRPARRAGTWPPARWWSRSTARPCTPWPSCGPASTC